MKKYTTEEFVKTNNSRRYLGIAMIVIALIQILISDHNGGFFENLGDLPIA